MDIEQIQKQIQSNLIDAKSIQLNNLCNLQETTLYLIKYGKDLDKNEKILKKLNEIAELF